MNDFREYNEVDILITLMSYVNVSSSQDMYYTIAHTILTHLLIVSLQLASMI